MSNPRSLTGKTALITGAAQRVGAVIATTLHAAGMDVVIHYRNSATDAEELAERLNGIRSGSAKTARADLADSRQIGRLISDVALKGNGLDVLINNASSFYPTPVGSVTEGQWDDLMASNLKAPFFLSQAAAPFLRPKQGCIVNLVDIHADRPLKSHPVYCMAKAGLVMQTKSLARELGPEIRVNGVAPGAILWPEEISDEAKDEIVARTALKRQGTPENIAEAVLYLVRDADYTTGQILAVDGGRTLSN